MKGSESINLALVGDHALNLYALASLLHSSTGLQVISICKDLRTLQQALESPAAGSSPDVVVLDVNFELRPAMQIIRAVRTAHPGVGLVVLGLTRDKEAILRLMQLGAHRYIPKNSDQNAAGEYHPRNAQFDADRHSMIPGPR